MPVNWQFRIGNKPFLAVLIFSSIFLAGCLQILSPQKPSPPPPQPEDPCIAIKEENESLQQALGERDQALADSKAKVDALEGDILSLNLKLLESQSLINEIQGRTESQQQRLDAAIVEVVRAKAKLRSIESKAEAVSTLAEAEIAVKEFKNQLPEADALASEEFTAAENLLKMSVEAFEAQNFGGALYLANQSKTQIRSIQARLSRHTEDTSVEGETPFSQSLPLKVIKRSNLRKGPGLNQEIVETIEPDTLVVGHAFKNNWVYIETEGGTVGWIYQTLIDAR